VLIILTVKPFVALILAAVSFCLGVYVHDIDITGGLAETLNRGRQTQSAEKVKANLVEPAASTISVDGSSSNIIPT
jgi:preprotein translocase subunit SecF